MTGPKQLRAVKTLVRGTLSDSFRIKPRTEVSSLLIVQPAAKFSALNPGWMQVATDTSVNYMYTKKASTAISIHVQLP